MILKYLIWRKLYQTLKNHVSQKMIIIVLFDTILYERLQFLDAFLVFFLRCIVHAFLLQQLSQAQDFFGQVVVVFPTLRPVDQFLLQSSNFRCEGFRRHGISHVECRFKILIESFQVAVAFADVAVNILLLSILRLLRGWASDFLTVKRAVLLITLPWNPFILF